MTRLSSLTGWLLPAAAVTVVACSNAPNDGAIQTTADTGLAVAAATQTPQTPTPAASGPVTDLPPNELGRIPILEYHLIGPTEARWTRTPENLRADMQLLYDRGYRPVNMVDVIDNTMELPAGTSPVVFVFDDASPSQFRYIERDGKLEIDPTSALGVWEEFQKSHPGWKSKAVFCVLSGAEAGRSFFGNKGIEGQKSEWRYPKLQYLNKQGFEICNHTLWHMTLSKYGDAEVQDQIARLTLAVDSAIPGYKIRTLALPLGAWPKNRALLDQGSWKDPKTGRTTTYANDVVLMVAGGPARSPHDPEFDPKKLPRVQVYKDELKRTLDALDAHKSRFVSDGNPAVVAKPAGSE